MEKFAIIGLGKFGLRLAKHLAKSGAEVIAIDRDQNLIEGIRDEVARAVCMDATDEHALRSQAIHSVDTAIVSIGSEFEQAVLTTVLLKQIGVRRVICRATSSIRALILTKSGADDIVNPEQESADRWRNRLIAPLLTERIELAEDFSLIQTIAPERFIGKTLVEIDVRKNYQVQVVAIRRTTEDTDADGIKRVREVVISVPMADTQIKKNDILLLIGSDDAIKSFVAE